MVAMTVDLTVDLMAAWTVEKTVDLMAAWTVGMMVVPMADPKVVLSAGLSAAYSVVCLVERLAVQTAVC